MNKIKVLTILGTRPELIKMSRVIDVFDKYTEHYMVHTGQNYDYELNEVFYKDLCIRKPDYYLNAAGLDASETIANVIKKTNSIIKKIKPDAILLYGDTNSCMAVIPAKRNKVPIFHMEAGNRCFDERVPEELNRKVIDHLSDINIVLTEHARRYLIREGIQQEKIFKLGSHMREVLNFNKNKINKSNILKTLNLNKFSYIICSIHREENVDEKITLKSIINSLEKLSKIYNKRLILSTHPRTEKKIKSFDIKNSNVEFLKPFGFFDYIKLQQNSYCVISDSGTITEESSLLGFPAVTLRQMHERPEGFDDGILIMSGFNEERIIQSVDIAVKLANDKNYVTDIVADYEEENVSYKLLKLVTSYIDYIKTNVWKIKF